MQQLPLPEPAAEGLKARAMQAAQAQQRHADFLAGVVLALGIDPSRVMGFDDEQGALLLRDEDEQPAGA